MGSGCIFLNITYEIMRSHMVGYISLSTGMTVFSAMPWRRGRSWARYRKKRKTWCRIWRLISAYYVKKLESRFKASLYMVILRMVIMIGATRDTSSTLPRGSFRILANMLVLNLLDLPITVNILSFPTFSFISSKVVCLKFTMSVYRTLRSTSSLFIFLEKSITNCS